jgi:hypothetical protein
MSQQSVDASPAFRFYNIFLGPTSCSLATGVCATTMVNTGSNSSYDLKVDGCQEQVTTFRDNYTAVSKIFGGTVGGFVVDRYPAGDSLVRFPFGTVATATCSLPPTTVSLERGGDQASGYFTMELISPLGSIPPGTSAVVGFQGTWNASSESVTVTSTLTSVSTSTIMSTTATTVTTTTISDYGTLPYLDQLLDVAVVVTLAVVSFLVLKRRESQQ